MKCKNCGTELQEGAMFCPECGTKVEVEEAVAETPVAETPVEETPVEETPVEETPVVETPAEETPVAGPSVDPVTEPAKKKVNKSVIIGVVAIIALVIVGVFLGKNLFGGKKNVNENMVVYLRKNVLCVNKNINAKKPEVYEICKISGLDTKDGFTSSGVYSFTYGYDSHRDEFYFFSKVDEDDGVGTLSRINLKKAKKDLDKNEKLVVEIDTKVSLDNVRVMSNGDVLYIKGDDKLVLYNGKESSDLAKNVSDFYADDKAGKVIIEKAADDEDDDDYDYGTDIVDLTMMDIKAGADEDKIAKDAHVFSYGANYVVYGTDYDEEDGSYEALYAMKDCKDAEKVAENVAGVYAIDYDDYRFFYTTVDTAKVNLYDLIDDPTAEKEKNAKEPETKDFLEKSSQEEALSEEWVEYVNEYSNGDVHDFITEWMSYKDSETGYYRVYNEDDYEYYYYDADNKDWYHYNEDAYYEAMSDYYSIADRVKLRDELKKEEVETSVYQLCSYEDGKAKVICEDVNASDIEATTGIVFFSQVNPDSSVGKVSIDNVYDADDAMFELGVGPYRGRESYSNKANFDGEYKYYVVGGEATDVELEGAVEYVTAVDDDKSVVVETRGKKAKDGYDITIFPVKGSKLGEANTLKDKGRFAHFMDGGKYLYFTNYSDEEADLYVFDGKNSEKIAKDVNINGTNYATDDKHYILSKDSNYVTDDYLIYNEKGDKVKLADEVKEFSYYAPDKIIFLSGKSKGELCLYKGEDDVVTLDTKVLRYWSRGEKTAWYLSDYISTYSYDEGDE